MNPSQLVWVFVIVAAHSAALVLLFFWLRRRLGLVPPPEPRPPKVPMPVFAADSAAAPTIPPDFPYRTVVPLAPEDRRWFEALVELHGPEYDVFPRVAAEACIEPTKDLPGYRERLRGRRFDFLVCDRAGGAVVAALLTRPGGKAGPEEYAFMQTCQAAGTPLTVLDAAIDPGDVAALRAALGWPDPL